MPICVSPQVIRATMPKLGLVEPSQVVPLGQSATTALQRLRSPEHGPREIEAFIRAGDLPPERRDDPKAIAHAVHKFLDFVAEQERW